jgi:hypothetical protein
MICKTVDMEPEDNKAKSSNNNQHPYDIVKQKKNAKKWNSSATLLLSESPPLSTHGQPEYLEK